MSTTEELEARIEYLEDGFTALVIEVSKLSCECMEMRIEMRKLSCDGDDGK